MARTVPMWVYKAALVLVTVIWGLGFVVMKDAVDVFPPAYLIGLRFLLTAIILNLVLFKTMKGTWRKEYVIPSLVLGFLEFMGFWVQTVGLEYTTPGINAFLTATYCVMVPFVWWAAARRKPSAFNILAAVLCVVGVGLVSLTSGEFSLGIGEIMTLLCAVFFALHIVAVPKCSEGLNILALTVYQFWVGGIMGLVLGFFIEDFPGPAAWTMDFMFNLFYLVVMCSCIALVLQNVALTKVPPSSASLFLSLESVFGVVFSVLVYGEQLTLRLVSGFALIFGAIIISEVFPLKPKKPGDDYIREVSLAGDQPEGTVAEIDEPPTSDRETEGWKAKPTTRETGETHATDGIVNSHDSAIPDRADRGSDVRNEVSLEGDEEVLKAL